MKQTHHIGYVQTPSVKNLSNVKNALVENGLVPLTTPNEMLPDAIEKGLENLKPKGTLEITENGTHDVVQYAEVNVNVAGGSVEVPPVTNLVVENGMLTFTKPDVTELINNGATISYLITVNETTREVEDSGVDINNYLITGANTISVVVKVMYLSNGSIIEYESREKTITTLSAKLPKVASAMGTAAVDKNIYLFGGNGPVVLDTINKFDTTSETLTTLSAKLPQKTYGIGTAAVDKNIYLFGGYTRGTETTINKFDTTSETITTLSAKLPQATLYMGTAAVDKNIYLFGGNGPLDTINKFDTTSETLTTLSVTLPKVASAIGAATVDKNIYLFGGRGASDTFDTINKFN